jgi:hypothetical protein
MGNFERQQEMKREAEQRKRYRAELYAKYFLDLSKLFFTALVLVSVVALIGHKADTIECVIMFVVGLSGTVLLAVAADKIITK